MKKHATWWQLVLLAAFAVALCYGAYAANQVGDHLQYLTAVPKPQISEEDNGEPPNQPIADAVKRLQDASDEWDTTMRLWTVGAVTQTAGFQGDTGESVSGRLELVGKNGLLVRPAYLLYGRLMYPEEIERGERVILLDEQLALKLFRVADPLGRKVTCPDGNQYEVIGILRHQKQVGDFTDYGARIPLQAIVDSTYSPDALLVEAEPVPGLGANVSFKTVVQNWAGEGTLFDLGKESMGATLWLRVLLFLVGMTVALRLIGYLNGRVRYYGKHYRRKLQVTYAVRMAPELVGAILLFALGYGLCAGLVAALMEYIIRPVYTFPEWIPAILVEWEDIAAAFWNVWQLPAVMTELRTPEILRLRWLTLLVQGCSAGAGVLLALIYARMRGSSQAMAESLRALYREGTIVSVIRTTKPIAMDELGYAVCENDPAWQSGKASVPMLRIINVRRVLEQLPAGLKDGSFVLEVTDELIPQNNQRWLITCQGGQKTVTEATREWDIQLPVQVLTRIAYGHETFADFLERSAGYDMRMRSPAMDGMFDHHLPLTQKTL